MTARYSLVLLDADGTLFDFARAERQAYTLTAREFGFPEDDETYQVYSAINERLWKKLERGEVDKDQLVLRRFAELLVCLGVEDEDPAHINDRYRHNLGEGAFLLPGAEEVCRALAPHCRLVLATNGITWTQNRRLARSAIAPYIQALVASESGGADKPDPRFFAYLDSQVGPVDKSATLMVGDRLEADILGGARFGVDTCWYNPRGLPAAGEVLPTYTIRALEELPGIVLAQSSQSSTMQIHQGDVTQ